MPLYAMPDMFQYGVYSDFYFKKKLKPGRQARHTEDMNVFYNVMFVYLVYIKAVN